MTTPDHTADLLPCPFCGEHEAEYAKREDKPWYVAICGACNAETSWCDTWQQAAALWNTRADLSLESQKWRSVYQAAVAENAQLEARIVSVESKNWRRAWQAVVDENTQLESQLEREQKENARLREALEHKTKLYEQERDMVSRYRYPDTTGS